MIMLRRLLNLLDTGHTNQTALDKPAYTGNGQKDRPGLRCFSTNPGHDNETTRWS